MLHGMRYATYPFRSPDSEACEIYGFSLALRNGIAPLHVVTDCANLERDVRSGKAFCCRHARTYAHVWKIVWHLLEEHGAVVEGRLNQSVVRVTWVRSHTTWQTASASSVDFAHWQLNRWADKGAKWGAFEQIPSRQVLEHIKKWTRRGVTVLKWLGVSTAKAHSASAPDHDPPPS